VIDRFVVVPASYVVFLRPGSGDAREVLLMLRSGTGYMDDHWATVAGHVEKGESVYDAARREAREEVGLTDLALTPWCAMQRTGSADGTGEPIDERVDYFFTCESWSGTPRIVEPQKCAGLQWVGLDDLGSLLQPVVPHERTVLDAVRAGRTDPIVVHGFDTPAG
jgi:8-oxo-dGTP pyrophosphatase MutT (NUDIX family)